MQELLEGEKPLNYRLLSMLSCPSREETVAFAAFWETIDGQRRQELITRMVELAEERFELDFVDLFRYCLSDTDPVVRRQAIEGLWEAEGGDLATALIKMVSADPDEGVRAAAASALGRFLFMAECEELHERYAQMIREALEQIIANANEPVEVVRRAVESIAFINDDRVRRIIADAYAHSDPRMRLSAVFAMGRSAEQVWAENILGELENQEADMRYEAARASGELQLKRAVPQLIKLVQGADREVQSVSIWALGQIGGKQARKALEQMVEQGDDEQSAAASEALQEMELLEQPLDLFLYEPEAAEWEEVGLEEDEDDEDEDEDDLDEWQDEFLDLD
ncbi:MAG: HEAT repeat domain-containing protein [Chloroflexi bacterium]|nr:HEAT repeat domain-containing protein [Chloroflexota bacterium]